MAEKISVIMSAYNSENLVGKAIESILNQSFTNFEFLIMDDCSLDSTFEILNKYEQTDKRIKVFRNDQNMGLTKSLNILIRNSRCSIIARQDADDTSCQNRFEVQIKYMKNFDVVTTLAKSIQSNKTIPGYSRFIPLNILIKYKNPFIHGTLMIKKSIFEKVDYYDENYLYAQDFKLYLDILRSGYKIKQINSVLYNLNTIGNISTVNRLEQKKYFLKAQKFYKEVL